MFPHATPWPSAGCWSTLQMPPPWGVLHGTTVRAAPLFCQPPNPLHHGQPGHRGLWEAVPKTGSPWGQAESFVVQVPLNIPARNHLQLCNACCRADCCQRPFKLWCPHPIGLCWHDVTSSRPSWKHRGVKIYCVHGSQQSTCTGDLQKCQFSQSTATTVVWRNQRGVLTQPQELKPAPGPMK